MIIAAYIGLFIATIISVKLLYSSIKEGFEWFTIVLMLTSYTFVISLFVIVFNYFNLLNMVTFYPEYTATVNHVEKGLYSVGGADKTEMYRATYSFVDNKNRKIEIKSKMVTGDRPFEGAKVLVAYKDGKFIEYDSSTTMQIVVMPLMIGFLLFGSLGLAFLAFDIPLEHMGKYVKFFLIRMAFPVVAGGVLLLLVDKLWLVWMGVEHISMVGVFLLILFSIIMLFFLYTLFFTKILFNSNGDK